jgi:hypothetical protein
MTKGKRAAEQELGELHADLARVLKVGLQFRDEDGKPNPALLNVARQFLKDNKIESEAPKGSPLGDLSDLPVFDDDMPDGMSAH